MLYLVFCSPVMIIALLGMWRDFLRIADLNAGVPGSRPQPGLTIFGIAMAFAFCAPLLYVFYAALKHGPDEGMPFMDFRWSVYALFAGSIMAVAYAVTALLRTEKNKRGNFWTVGQVTLLVGAAVVGIGSSVSHLSFFSSSSAGIANIGFLREIADIQDMNNCRSDIALVKFKDSGPLEYRCPTAIAFGGGFSSEPFVPWPSYVNGESQQLGEALRKVTESAEKPGSDQQ